MDDGLAVINDGISTPEGLIEVQFSGIREVPLELTDNLLTSAVEGVNLLLDITDSDNGIREQGDDTELQ